MSIKIKICITYVYNGHEVKIKMVEELWLQLEMRFLLGEN